jgi:hypothetical protein
MIQKEAEEWQEKKISEIMKKKNPTEMEIYLVQYFMKTGVFAK